jgi:vanillate monooxygenase
MSMFPRNFWYVAAWDHEITQKPFARTICGEDIVFFRKSDRSIVALEDCCPHRLLPLSMGFVQNDRLVCGYHGLEFGADGACLHMPNQERIPSQICARAYPVAERHRFVWIWIGDIELANEDDIPDLHYCSDPDWAFDGDMYHVQCDYRLLVDNLMDLTHETYVHPTSIGQQEIAETPIEASHDDKSVTLTRWMLDIKPPPFWASNLKSDDPCDRWQICNFTLPANVMIDVGVAKTGTGAAEGNRSQGVSGMVVDLMTPETETSTWYFWGMARDFEVTDQGLSRRIKDAQSQVFGEDIDVLESQQRNIEARPNQKLVNFNIDVGGVRARRLIDKAMEGM